MVLKRWFKDRQSDIEAPPQEIVEPLIHQLSLRIRGTFDLDDILQLAADSIGEQLKVDHCLVYLCDPNADTLRWRAGYQEPLMAPLRWPLRESDFPDLFVRLRKGEPVLIDDPLHNPLVASGHGRFESAGVRTLVFVPATSEQLEAVLVLGQVREARKFSELELRMLETVAAHVAMAARHVTLSSALRRAGTQVASATAELQTENQQLQGLLQLLLLPPAELPQVLNHITQSLADLYRLKACSIEELQPPSGEIRNPPGEIRNVSPGDIRASDFPAEAVATVRSLCLSGHTTNLGVFPIQGSPRQQVVESAQPRVVFNAAGEYPEDQFLKENTLNFYTGVPIVNRAGGLIGLLNLYHPETVHLQKRDLKTLSALARRIGFELEDERATRARAAAEHEIQWRLEAATQWEEQMKFLQEARELLRQSDLLETGLQELIVSANRHMGSDFAAIALYRLRNAECGMQNEEKSAIRNPQSAIETLITAGIDPPVREAIGDLPTGRGLLGLLTDWSGPLRLDNLAHHPRFTGFPANHPVMRSFLAVPLRVRGATVGAIYFADKNGGEPFSNEDELFATELAAQIAVAVAAPIIVKTRMGEWENGRMGEEVETSPTLPLSHSPTLPDPWPFFSDLFVLIERGSSVERVCTSLVDALMAFFPGSAAAIWLLEPSRESLVQVAGRGAPSERLANKGPIRLGEGLIGRAAIRGQSLAVRKTEDGGWRMEDRELRIEDGDPRSSILDSRSFPDEPYSSATIVPLKTRDKTLGLILIFGTDPYPTEKERVGERESGRVGDVSASSPILPFPHSPTQSKEFLEVVAYCLGSFVDQSRMMETVSHRSQEMAKMQTVIASISEPSNLGKVCDEILNQLADSLDVSHGALYLRQSPERELLLFRHRGLNEALAGLGQRMAVEQAEDSISGLTSGEPLIIAELESDPRLRNRALVDVLRAEGLRSGIILPLLAPGGETLQENIETRNDKEAVSDFGFRASDFPVLLGLLVLASPEPNHFTHYSHEFFSILTNRIASTIEMYGRVGEWESGRVGDALAHSPIPPLAHSQFLEALLENLSSGVVAIDREKRITVFNPAMERLTGYRRHEALGQQISGQESGRMGEWESGRRDEESPIPPFAHSPIRLFVRGNPLDEVLIQGREMTWEETPVLMKGGGKKYVSLTVTPLCDERGALAGALGLFTDITEIRALEHERYRLTPLALIGEMSARLAHEIKNPLASMMSGLELLQRRLQYGEREGRYFERLIAELQRLDTTVREMLAYSRTTPPLRAPADPADPLEHALDTLMPQLDAGRIAVKRDYQLGLEPALMDANQMEQVFLNLIINAMHAMPDGGTLGLRIADCGLRNEGATDQEQSEIRNPKSEIEYAISDTGGGIRPDVMDKIFDPFFSTKTHGTGLGLASVKKIIEAHQGQISVESQPGEGTTFTIRLKQQPPTETMNG